MDTCSAEDCEWYEVYPSKCQDYDDSEFSASELCCACGNAAHCHGDCNFYGDEPGQCGKFDDADFNSSFNSSTECCACDSDTPCASCDPCYPDGHGGSKVKPKYFVFKFVGGSETDISNDQDGKATVTGDTLSPGASFGASCTAKGSPAIVTITNDLMAVSDFEGADIECVVTAGGSKQTIGIHVSCSKNLLIGDRFGAIKLVDFYPLNHGESGLDECAPSNNGGNGGKGGKGGKGHPTMGRRRYVAEQ